MYWGNVLNPRGSRAAVCLHNKEQRYVAINCAVQSIRSHECWANIDRECDRGRRLECKDSQDNASPPRVRARQGVALCNAPVCRHQGARRRENLLGG